jgi:hypothetical protein
MLEGRKNRSRRLKISVLKPVFTIEGWGEWRPSPPPSPHPLPYEYFIWRRHNRYSPRCFLLDYTSYQKEEKTRPKLEFFFNFIRERVAVLPKSFLDMNSALGRQEWFARAITRHMTASPYGMTRENVVFAIAASSLKTDSRYSAQPVFVNV